MLAPFCASISAMSCGVETMTTPIICKIQPLARLKVITSISHTMNKDCLPLSTTCWLIVNCVSPVPGGMSITRTSSSPQSTWCKSCWRAFITFFIFVEIRWKLNRIIINRFKGGNSNLIFAFHSTCCRCHKHYPPSAPSTPQARLSRPWTPWTCTWHRNWQAGQAGQLRVWFRNENKSRRVKILLGQN